MNFMKRHRVGFTLMELMIVISIIITLAGLLLPALTTAKERSRRLSCASNLHQIGLGMLLYANDYANHFPVAGNPLPSPTTTWDALLCLSNSYVTTKVFKCPDDNLGRSPAGTNRSYAIAIGLGGNLNNPNNYWIQGSRLTCGYLTSFSDIAIVTESFSSQGIINSPHNFTFEYTNEITSAHFAITANWVCNYLFLDAHVAWVNNTNNFLAMFPAAPACGTPPCCK